PAAPTRSGPAEVVEEPPTPGEVPVAPATLEAVAPESAGAPRRDWERLLVENWLVWLGGAALALGGGFLVKLSIDYGLLTPPVRVVLGIVLGIALAVGGEWVMRRELAEAGEARTPSYVPQALAAGGAATVFASLYAAYALYDL